ncbi:hypothetical protein CANARDRAFT_21240 [[Candida] arabinofermentans NRRL YB-2248]|uniref:B-related factor 1 n=1 Tax=[Candida] arabinofermentans NRRL YB-2248 TaxID=983967 RepID=A0A1E4T685_9ASCO|nr:hypothetical protein CANARDRAFT_21240 [[Candida] arabinofermentans NRRL YB-2248]
MSLRCTNCGHTDLVRDHNTASSDLACARCGTVMEENPIVSEVTFGENAAGAATVQGAFVGSDQSRANFGNNRGSLDSREQTLANGKKRIKNVASALRIPDFISDAAYQWFQLALTNNFVQGRRSQNVVAACLYVACRKEKTHHMLIDFSSRLQISVYAVGATFLKMVKALHITSLPLVDPSLFIQHFSDRLNFGKMKLKVIQDAVKIAHRMSEDWIHEGRRPAGIAGACILLAARMNNFRRTHTEIVAVTHIGHATIQKRLDEFKRTDASKMTVEQFRNEGHTAERSLPPAFQKNRKAEKKIINRLQNENRQDEMLNDPVLSALMEDSNLNEDDIKSYIKKIFERQDKDDKRKLNVVLQGSDFVPDIEEPPVKVETELDKMIARNKPKNLTTLLKKYKESYDAISNDPENLEDVDDDEIEGFLLTEEESKLKERLWVGSNQEYLIEQETKRLKEEADKIAGHNQHPKKKRRQNGRSNGGDDSLKNEFGEYLSSNSSHHGLTSVMNQELSAAENAKNLLKKKSLSKKINYDAVNELFDD